MSLVSRTDFVDPLVWLAHERALFIDLLESRSAQEWTTRVSVRVGRCWICIDKATRVELLD
jgi:hypothetical protein